MFLLKKDPALAGPGPDFIFDSDLQRLLVKKASEVLDGTNHLAGV